MPKISRLVHKNLNFLNALKRTRSPSKVTRLLANAKNHELLALVEIALNILSPRSNLKLRSSQKRPLYAHAQLLRRISRAKSAESARRLLQKGGALGLLPAILAPI